LLYEPLVARWCHRYQLQEADSADVCQEVFKAVWRKLGEFRRDPPRQTFHKWLRTIAVHKIIDRWREAKNAAVGEGGSEAQARFAQLPDPAGEEETLLGEETALLYRRALALLQSDFQPRTVEAFWLYAVEELSAEAVAERLQVSLNTVYLARSRVPRRVREEFGDVLDIELPPGGASQEV
jgi:RNA polymerase sigma-70 factor (ECF subfamily)